MSDRQRKDSSPELKPLRPRRDSTGRFIVRRARSDWTRCLRNRRTRSGSFATRVRVFNGTMCLDAYQKKTAPGTKVDIYTCNGGTNQQWRINADGTVVGVESGLCLDVIGQSNANGTAVEIWTCNGGSNQKWSRQ